MNTTSTATLLTGLALSALFTLVAQTAFAAPDAPTAPAAAGHTLRTDRLPEVATAAAEDSWWQVSARLRRSWVGAGMGVQFTSLAEVPTGSHFLAGTVGHGVQVGHWLKPWMAIEGELFSASGQEGALFGGGTASIQSEGAQVGLRFALPIYITPVAAVHVGYQHVSTAWTLNDKGLFKQDAVQPTATGVTRDDALFVHGEVGLSASRGPVSLSLTMQTSRALVHDAQTQLVAGTLEGEKLGSDNPHDPGFRVAAAWRF